MVGGMGWGGWGGVQFEVDKKMPGLSQGGGGPIGRLWSMK